ncbi:hypothetical protein LJC45_05345 [Alistipes sp. OttesenSCG-928-B03]|nr:hypothetical protein [Alistipes sp. OttesenSCG-928-B03]
MKMNKMECFGNSKSIIFRTPSTFIWIFTAIAVFVGVDLSWLTKGLPDLLFWMICIVSMGMYVIVFFLLKKYYSRKSLRRIIVSSDDNVLLVYYFLRYGNSETHDYNVRKQNIKIVVKGNVMTLWEKDEAIAKVYKDTLTDKEDWDWLINYFAN